MQDFAKQANSKNEKWQLLIWLAQRIQNLKAESHIITNHDFLFVCNCNMQPNEMKSLHTLV